MANLISNRLASSIGIRREKVIIIDLPTPFLLLIVVVVVIVIVVVAGSTAVAGSPRDKGF